MGNNLSAIEDEVGVPNQDAMDLNLNVSLDPSAHSQVLTTSRLRSTMHFYESVNVRIASS